MFKAGGKRFRPLMLLQIVETYEPLLLKNAYWVAAAVEMLHTYSLIHDDLPTFDDSDLRRGHPTLHVTYDEVTATLVGDALNSHSFLMIADAPLSDSVKVALIKELSLNGGTDGMVLGQAIDCYFEDKKLSLDELTFLHIHKTAKLIAASLKMGAIIVDLDKEQQNLLYKIGLNIGLLFQVQDDIIDATLTTDEAGKPTNHDSSKNSFTNLLGVAAAQTEKEKLKTEIETQLSKLDDALQNRLQSSINKYFK
ncbi:MAG: polyprenyl synthetase family protein [Epsilonproteobacteria bacterium]|nr:polyprenyl synthetase family protein [Campylobacterota bacterium]